MRLESSEDEFDGLEVFFVWINVNARETDQDGTREKNPVAS